MQKKIEWRFVKGETDEEMINDIEKKLDIKFPEDYLEYIRKYPHGYPFPYNSFKNKKLPHGKGIFTALIPLNLNDDGNLLKSYNNLNHHTGGDNQIPDGIIPFAFADNNYLCFDYRFGFIPKIIFLDLEKHWEYLDYLSDPKNCREVKEEDYLIHICNSFTELLDMLEEEPKEN
jgi:hypothetical protein